MEKHKKTLQMIEEIRNKLLVLPESDYNTLSSFLDIVVVRLREDQMSIQEKKFLFDLLKSYRGYEKFLSEQKDRKEVIFSLAKEKALEIYQYECEDHIQVYKKLFSGQSGFSLGLFFLGLKKFVEIHISMY